jgi:hypothetical protein
LEREGRALERFQVVSNSLTRVRSCGVRVSLRSVRVLLRQGGSHHSIANAHDPPLLVASRQPLTELKPCCPRHCENAVCDDTVAISSIAFTAVSM